MHFQINSNARLSQNTGSSKIESQVGKKGTREDKSFRKYKDLESSPGENYCQNYLAGSVVL